MAGHEARAGLTREGWIKAGTFAILAVPFVAFILANWRFRFEPTWRMDPSRSGSSSPRPTFWGDSAAHVAAKALKAYRIPMVRSRLVLVPLLAASVFAVAGWQGAADSTRLDDAGLKTTLTTSATRSKNRESGPTRWRWRRRA